MPLLDRFGRPCAGQLSLLDYGAERAERIGVPPERIVTTWSLDKLREWTGRDRGA